MAGFEVGGSVGAPKVAAGTPTVVGVVAVGFVVSGDGAASVPLGFGSWLARLLVSSAGRVFTK